MNQRLRREPPKFRRVAVKAIQPVTPRLTRITLGGAELDGMDTPGLAASVRMLLSEEMPTWNGNEFLLADGGRPVIRTFTPLRFSADQNTLDIEVVRHAGGAASDWAAAATVGNQVALSGPGRGYEIDRDATSYLLAGDETALPAITQLLGALGEATAVEAHVEVAEPSARIDGLPHTTWHELPAGATPGDALVATIESLELDAGAKVWVAGEAAAVQRIRQHLFNQRGLPRSQAAIRGYWKHGRTGGDED